MFFVYVFFRLLIEENEYNVCESTKNSSETVSVFVYDQYIDVYLKILSRQGYRLVFGEFFDPKLIINDKNECPNGFLNNLSQWEKVEINNRMNKHYFLNSFFFHLAMIFVLIIIIFFHAHHLLKSIYKSSMISIKYNPNSNASESNRMRIESFKKNDYYLVNRHMGFPLFKSHFVELTISEHIPISPISNNHNIDNGVYQLDETENHSMIEVSVICSDSNNICLECDFKEWKIELFEEDPKLYWSSSMSYSIFIIYALSFFNEIFSDDDSIQQKLNDFADCFELDGIGFFVYAKNSLKPIFLKSINEIDVVQSTQTFIGSNLEGFIFNSKFLTIGAWRIGVSVIRFGQSCFVLSVIRKNNKWVIRAAEQWFLLKSAMIFSTLYSFCSKSHDQVLWEAFYGTSLLTNVFFFNYPVDNFEKCVYFGAINGNNPSHSIIHRICSMINEYNVKTTPEISCIKSKGMFSSVFSKNYSDFDGKFYITGILSGVVDIEHQRAMSFVQIQKLFLFRDDLSLISTKLGSFLGFSQSNHSLKDYIDFQSLKESLNGKKQTIFQIGDHGKANKSFLMIPFLGTQSNIIGYVTPLDFYSIIPTTIAEISDTLMVSVWLINAETQETVWAVLGTDMLSDHEKKSISLKNLFKSCHPEDLGKLEGGIAHSSKVSNSNLTFDIRLKSRSNEYEWYHVYFSRRPGNYYIAAFYNANEMKNTTSQLIEADLILNNALNYADVTSWTFDDCSAPQRIQPIKPKNNVPWSTNWTTIKYHVASEFQDVMSHAFLNSLQNGGTFSFEVPFLFETIRWLSFHGTSTGKSGKLIGIYFDITTLKEAIDDVETEKIKIEEALAAKSTFLANMTHEFRNPLSGICGLIELLGLTQIKNEYKEMVTCLEDSFQKLQQLLNDVLDLAKIDSKKLKPNYIQFDPISVCSEAITAFYPSSLKGGIQLMARASPSIPLVYFGEPHFLSRIISNLLSNAIKFTPSGSVAISICDKEAQERSYIQIKVRDSGIGISAENQKIIFDNFSQGDSSITRPFGGMGVGLSLVKKMLEIIGGTISLKSSLGHGSVFKARIPFEPLFIPYVPQSFKERHIQLLLLINSEFAQKDSEECAKFYSFEMITDPNLVSDRLSIIVTSFETIELSLSIHKKYPDSLIALVCNPGSSLKYHDPSIRVFYRPFAAISLMRAYLNMYRKKQVETRKKSVSLDFSRLTMLAADDSITNQLVIRKICEKINCRIVIVENGIEAIDELNNNHFDIALFDQHMPLLDGKDLIRQIRHSNQKWANIPIIAMSASSNKESEAEIIAAGANIFISKPILISKLKQAIIIALESKSQS